MTRFRSRWSVVVGALFLAIVGVVTWVALDQRRQVHEYQFMAAAAQGNVSRLTELLAKVDVNARFGGDGETALHRSAARGHLQAVALLLDRGANVNAVDDEGNTPLLAATYRSHVDVVAMLLKRGAFVNAQEKRHGFTPLLQAVAKNDKQLVQLLLAHGADVSLKTVDGRTALDRALANGAKDIVVLLKQAAEKK